MTRRDFIWKWSAYGVALLVTTVVQAYVLSRLPVLGVTAVLLPQAVAAMAVLEGPTSGAGLGVAAGVVSMSLFHGGPMAIVAYALIGLLVGLVTQYVLRQDFWGCVICTGVALALRGACLVVPRYAAGVAPLPVLLRVAVPELVYSFLLTGLVYLLFRFVCHKFGRIALA